MTEEIHWPFPSSFEKWEAKETERLVNLLAQVLNTASNIGISQFQIMKENDTLFDVVERLYKELGVADRPCGKCKILIPRFNYELGQGMCGSCITEIMAESEGTI